MKYIKIEIFAAGRITKTPTNDTKWLNEYFHFYPSGDYRDMPAYGTVCLPNEVDVQIPILKDKLKSEIKEKLSVLKSKKALI